MSGLKEPHKNKKKFKFDMIFLLLPKIIFNTLKFISFIYFHCSHIEMKTITEREILGCTYSKSL